MMQPPAVTISIAALNEEDSILAVLEEAVAVLDNNNIKGEILVIDDASTDRTPEILKQFQDKEPRLKIFTHRTNYGIKGFSRRMVAEASGEWILFISADGECNLQDLPVNLKLAREQGVDGVLTYRVNNNYSLFRNVISWFFNFSVRVFFGMSVKDVGNMRLLKRSVYAPIPLYCQSAFINAERILAGHRLGAKIIEVPTENRKRTGGKAKGAQLAWVLQSFWDMIKTRRRFIFFDSYYRLGRPNRPPEDVL